MKILRRQILTHRNLQYKLAFVISFWFVIFIMAFGTFYFLNYRAFTERTAAMHIYDQMLTRVLLPDQSPSFAILYGLAALGYVLLLGCYVVVYSHRFTGPIYKMTKMLEEAAEKKEWPKELKFRNTDAFKDLADAFNKFSENLKPKT